MEKKYEILLRYRDVIRESEEEMHKIYLSRDTPLGPNYQHQRFDLLQSMFNTMCKIDNLLPNALEVDRDLHDFIDSSSSKIYTAYTNATNPTQLLDYSGNPYRTQFEKLWEEYKSLITVVNNDSKTAILDLKLSLK